MWFLFFKSAQNYKEIVFPVPMMFAAFLQIFFLCELGERITHQYNEIDEEICRMKWYLLPIRMQKILPTIMIGTQTPVMLAGFGNMRCTREDFKTVRNLFTEIFTYAKIYT